MMVNIQFDEQTPAPYTSSRNGRGSFLSRFFINTGLARDQRSAQYWLFGIFILGIALTAFILTNLPDTNSPSVPPPGYIPPNQEIQQ